MRLQTREVLSKSFTGLSLISIVLMALALLILLGPIILRGLEAFFFSATVEHRLLLAKEFDRGDRETVLREHARSVEERQFIYDAIAAYEPEARHEVEALKTLFNRGEGRLDDLAPDHLARVKVEVAAALDQYVSDMKETLGKKEKTLAAGDAPNAAMLKTDIADLKQSIRIIESKRDIFLTEGKNAVLDSMDIVQAAQLEGRLMEIEAGLTAPLDRLQELKDILRELFGPFPGDPEGVLMRQDYGQTRWDRALVKHHDFLYITKWVKADPTSTKLVMKEVPRKTVFEGTAVAPIFDQLTEAKLAEILNPSFTFYLGFLLDKSYDDHRFGGIWPEVLGTLALTIGAMIFAIPMGIIAAIYLAEYARDTWVISLLRSCISTLAGVPSIVFGLFGLAFFIDTIHVSDSRSLLAGSLTLALLVLPTIIRASEEAILAVPGTYKEAAMGLGATRWHTVVTVILPASLPGILTGIVISMGRAAGETAPIIFTAAVSLGAALPFSPDAVTSPTPALPWNIYNLCSENESVDEIRHVQYGMVLTLVSMVLFLNAVAIYLRARIQKKLRG